jgi:site-specific DNA-methyltransferase (adenine-specific)
MKQYHIICSDNVSALAQLPENSIDACITDPPYGMDIAGAGWDKNVPPRATWEAVFRVLKPGAFVLSFCNPEFYHRMAVNVEDAGFIPKDMIIWMVTTKMAKANRLKPAHEPIFVAQKPLDGTIENNVATWGCGRINTTTTRVPWDGKPPKGWIKGGVKRRAFGGDVAKAADAVTETEDANPNGRYPTDIIGHFDEPDHQKYFYAPRATRKERGEYNDHPTPKPINLMRYLCRVYAPQGGVVLDPFMGSGSTGIAALQEGMEFYGIDLSQHYCDIVHKRITDHVVNQLPADKLFDYEP